MLFATIGCSFTRGERLFYHRYIDDDELSQKFRPTIPIFGKVPDRDGSHMAVATKQDKRFMLDISYTGLLSKRLNCEYFTKSGDNFDNIDRHIPEWVEMSRTVPERKLDFIVLQLTEPQRDLKKFYGDDGHEFWDKLKSFSTSPEEKKKLLHHLEVEIPEQTVSKVLKTNKLCKDNDIDLFVWSWGCNSHRDGKIELSKMLKDEDFFVKIEYEGKEYISYNQMTKHYRVSINQVFDSKDTHPNKFFNRVLYDSIIRKLKEKGIIYDINTKPKMKWGDLSWDKT
jgi:hypothetical protein